MLNSKNFLTAFCGWTFAPLILYFERYVFDDWQFIISMIVMVAVDTILGFSVGLTRRNVSSQLFARVFKKILVYFALLIATHAAATYKVRGELNTVMLWIDGVVYAAIMVRELISVIENCGALGIGIPPYILAKFKNFDENGKFNKDADLP